MTDDGVVYCPHPFEHQHDCRSSLEAFEALVLSQQPAKAPWAPVLPYDIETRRHVEGQQPTLIRDVFACTAETPILDYGCGAGFLVAFLAELGLNVRGYEPAKPLRDKVPPYVRELVSHRIGIDTDFPDGRPRYHLVICREVLEHLTLLDIRTTVRDLCRWSKKFVYVTTRFSSEHDILRVETSDDLDPTHITIPSKDLLRLLFVLEGFKRRADLEARMDWKQLNRCLVYERAV